MATDHGASRRPFYGWLVVAACFGILLLAYGIQFSYGVFLPAMAAETGWDRTSLSLAFSIYVFVYSILGAASGWCTDRFGPRLVIGAGALLLGGGLLLTSRVDALWQLYISLGLIAALGMSAIYVPCNATVVRWFVWRRGLALGIASSGHGFGNLLIPPLAAVLMAGYGWRATYALLALAGGLLILVCALVMVRDPERLGQYADGIAPAGTPQRTPPEHAARSAQPSREIVWTLASARRTAALWLVVAVFTMTFLVIFLPMVHLVPFALDLGMTPVRASLAVGMIGAGSLVGRLLSGAVSDRLGRQPTLGVALSLQALTFMGFWASTDAGLLFPSALLFGLATGGTSTLLPAIVGDFFGRLSVGAIFGFVWAIAASAAAFGPLIAGYMYDRTGSYADAFALSAALNVVAACLVLFLRKPAPPARLA
jgi:MFS transporter, OFA family, oxalate/formate antiporter